MMRTRTLLTTAALALAIAAPSWAKGDPFADFVSPSTSPVIFEDARPTTELRAIHQYQHIGVGFGSDVGISGGDLNILLIQARLALSERFALLINKAGYVWLRPDEESYGTFETDDGWANVAFGAKYAVYRDPDRNAIATFGLRYESASGDKDVYQGHRGDGLMNPFLSAAWGYNQLHLSGYTGPRIPISGNDSTFWDTNLHVDRKFGPFYPVVELSWNQTLDGGRRLNLNQEGFDFFNFGSRHAGSHAVVTGAIGFRFRPLEAFGVDNDFSQSDIGFTYEAPLTSERDFLGWRLLTDFTIRYD
jgi:hypothetical protein